MMRLCLLAAAAGCLLSSCSEPSTPQAAPQFETQPADLTVNEGATAQFSSAVTSADPATFQWKRNGVTIEGATSSSYSFTATADDDQDVFTVVASNGTGSTTSRQATLAVRLAPRISTQPSPTTVEQGSQASFTVTASGATPLSYQWKRNGSAIAGATAASYSFTPAASDDDATYSVAVSNVVGSLESDAVKLDVRVPTIVAVTFATPGVTVGETMQASASLLDQDGAAFTGRTFTWASVDTAVAVVSSSGEIRGVTRGSVNVSATSAGLTGVKSVQVNSPAGLYGESCENRTESDVITGAFFVDVNTIGNKYYYCLVVDTTEGHPVLTGRRSLRFEQRPGDCSSNAGYDDCSNDRRRHEIYEPYGEHTAKEGETFTFEHSLFIPAGQTLKPAGPNALFLTQYNVQDANGAYTALGYLEVLDGDQLVLRTHEGFTFDLKAQHPLASDITGRWINIVTEIRYTTASDGYIKVAVDGVEKVHEVRPTLQNAQAWGALRIGIYNAFLSWATEPYGNQVVYFDRVIKTKH